MITFTSVTSQVQAIIKKRSKEIAQREFERIRSRFLDTLRDWKTEVRMLLSTPHMKGIPNTSKFPQMRTGGLRKSLSYRTSITHRPNTTSYKLTTKVLWDEDPSRFTSKGPTGVDYGSLLNSANRFKDKTFFGWRDRTYDLLRKRIRDSLK